MTKRHTNLILGVIILIVAAFALLFSGDSTKSVTFDKLEEEKNENVYEKEIIGESIQASISPGTQLTPLPSDQAHITPIEEEIISDTVPEGYKVVKVVDGDTLDVNIDGKIERLRLIGIDTPETVDPRKEVQCFGIEASSRAKELLSGQFVTLESDDSQGERDKYKRLLRYVILPDGTNFNLYMIAEGYAHEYTYDEAYNYQVQFKQAEVEARNNSKGLWSPETCSGNK